MEEKIQLFCCESCARKAKKNNPAFEIKERVFFIGAGSIAEFPDCDICGEQRELYLCFDPA